MQSGPDDFFVYFELITIDIYSQCLQIQIPYPAEHWQYVNLPTWESFEPLEYCT